MPSPPPAINWVPVQVTLFNDAVVPESRSVQVIPSGEVRIAANSPTATNWVPVQITALKADALARHVQCTPSLELKIASPTATIKLPEDATPPSTPAGPDNRVVQVTSG